MKYWYAAKCECGQITRLEYTKSIVVSSNSHCLIYDYKHLSLYDCRLTKVDSNAIKKGQYSSGAYIDLKGRRLRCVILINLVCNSCNKNINIRKFERLKDV